MPPLADARWMVPQRPGDAAGARTAYFRRPFTHPGDRGLRVGVAAGGRYVLYLDGERVARGVRAAAITLRPGGGEHVLGAVVTGARDPRAGPRFAARLRRDGAPVAGRWCATRDHAYQFPGADPTTAAFPRETLDGRAYPAGWWAPGFGRDWPAADRGDRLGGVTHGESVRGVTEGSFVDATGAGQQVVGGAGSLRVPAGETAGVTARAGERVVGFAVVTVDACAAGATVEVGYRPERAGGDRFVSPAGEHTYLPLDPRRFEAVDVSVTAGDGPVEVTTLRYRGVAGGPLEPGRGPGLVRFDRNGPAVR
jgi:hypothetical protein